ncbi:cytochrome c oxidase assembly protein CtaG/Cox11 [Methylocella silvestris BL2]|uniref:Cytochrome c oxidase assembly protein CtaG n=1 Tax=Methylocella silvestris (strain DSM 15510 / CIP 108128 / LMG 27833 / NCIMB 13906 / BL2) TaxID=395965 RepID=B8EPK5_METSB|nr:cytochrome c oxidase assembly protein [Methylocella silvestris]ACK50210.1 cytochrome c oxidase assembly protein CtaG/Cox11 [Methylocella silvestris BL2]
MSASPDPKSNLRKGRLIAAAAAAACLAMLGLSFAAVPLYRMFCAATGYGGTTQVARTAPANAGKRELTVRFDANVAPGLNWSFEPETTQINLRTGQTATVYFKIVNRSDKPVSAIAGYNVGPDSAGLYFSKISCFCFNEMTLAGHETAELPVVFFLDPALEAEKSLADVDTIVLSYTLFGQKPKGKLAAGESPSGKTGKPL